MSVYFHTYAPEAYERSDVVVDEAAQSATQLSSACGAVAALVRALQPVRHSIDMTHSTARADTYRKVLSLVATDPHAVNDPSNLGAASRGAAWDAVLLVRFDVMYARPITQLGVRWDRVNVAFKNLEPYWKSDDRKVSDLFFALPGTAVDSFVRAIDNMTTVLGKDANLEYIYPSLASQPATSDVHFVEDRYCTSRIDEGRADCPGTFLWIDRRCPRSSDLCDVSDEDEMRRES